MPPASPYLAVNARISVSPRFLRSLPVYESLRTTVSLDTPGIKLFGVITGPTTINDRPAWLVKLDQLPDQEISLLPTSFRFEGRRSATRRPAPSVTPAPTVEAEDPNFMDNAMGESSEAVDADVDADEELDLCWQEGEVTVDRRVANPNEAFSGRATLHLPAKEYASPALYS